MSAIFFAKGKLITTSTLSKRFRHCSAPLLLPVWVSTFESIYKVETALSVHLLTIAKCRKLILFWWVVWPIQRLVKRSLESKSHAFQRMFTLSWSESNINPFFFLQPKSCDANRQIAQSASIKFINHLVVYLVGLITSHGSCSFPIN